MVQGGGLTSFFCIWIFNCHSLLFKTCKLKKNRVTKEPLFCGNFLDIDVVETEFISVTLLICDQIHLFIQ